MPDADTIMVYEAYLRKNGVSANTSSFYLRNLRAVYNRAVEKELTAQRYPFKHIYTGVDKTVKRALPLKAVKEIKEMNLSQNPPLDFARDMFLFSFYTRDMSLVDRTSRTAHSHTAAATRGPVSRPIIFTKKGYLEIHKYYI